METRTDGLEKTAEELRKENINLKEELVKMKDKLESVEKNVVDNSGVRILEEVSERASKERNVVLHNCVESKALSSEDIQRDDLNGIQSLFSELGLRDTYAKDILLGWIRLGQKKDLQARPLLLIFKTRFDRDMVLDRAPSDTPCVYYQFCDYATPLVHAHVISFGTSCR